MYRNKDSFVFMAYYIVSTLRLNLSKWLLIRKLISWFSFVRPEIKSMFVYFSQLPSMQVESMRHDSPSVFIWSTISLAYLSLPNFLLLFYKRHGFP